MAPVATQTLDQPWGIRLRIKIFPAQKSDIAPAADSARWSAGDERGAVSDRHALLGKVFRHRIDQPAGSKARGLAATSRELQEDGPRGIRPRDTTLDKLCGRAARDPESSRRLPAPLLRAAPGHRSDG